MTRLPLVLAGFPNPIGWTVDKVKGFVGDAASEGFEAIIGGEPSQNAAAFRALLAGETGAYRDAVLLNAAAALLVAGAARDLREGAVMAAESIDSGAAKARLTSLADVTGPPEP